MIIGRVLHQQIFQLKWHVLACVAIIMVLPLEEAAVNLHAGDGFFSSSLTGAALLLAPLLAGLIACANVQADMDEKRYLFWRSKPVSIAAIVPLKYVTGLIMGLVIIICPVLFSVTSVRLCAGHRAEGLNLGYVIAMSVISCLAYSVCFLTNVLVRKTARAWLIGMALTCFLLLAPFVLPLGITDIVSDVAILWASAACLSVTLGTALLAFVLAILAVKHDWHLHTSLRGLLWAGAGLIFGLMLLFSRQVANIRILDEKAIEKPMPGNYFYYRGRRLERQGDKTVVRTQDGLQNRYEVEVDGHRISLNPIPEKPSESARAQLKLAEGRFAVEEGLISKPYYQTGVYHEIGPELYFLAVDPYCIEKQVADKYGNPKKEKHWKKAYLRSSRVEGGLRIPQASLDLSDCISEERFPYAALRLVKDNLMALTINRHCMTIQVSDSGDLNQIERKKLKAHSPFFTERKRAFELPLVPLSSLDITDRIRLSIDTIYVRHRPYSNPLDNSLVHIHNDEITFVLISDRDIARYDVIKRDQDSVYCRFRDARPFTLLELQSNRHERSPCFVQDGKLYAYDWQTLMVFDIRAKRSTRKLGHLERISTQFSIDGISVEDNGDILMLADTNQSYLEGHKPRWSLYLLKNPQ